jgi:hypothetical protein
MATKRRYTTKQRAEAIGIAVMEGQTEAGRQTGIPPTTIDRWLDRPECVEMRSRAREEIIADVRAAFLLAVDRTAELLRSPDADLRSAADAMDKLGTRLALLSGEATTRTESRALTEGLDDHERTALRDAIDAWVTRQPAPAGAEGDQG